MSSKPSDPVTEALTLKEVFALLWSGKWIVLATAFVVTLLTIVWALSLPNIYRSEALLSPNQQEQAGGLSDFASRYGGLASLAGFSVNDLANNDVAIGLETLKSRRFISGFIAKHDILVPLMAAKDWNAETRVLEIDANVYNAETETWTRSVSPPLTVTPSDLEAHRAFLEILEVDEKGSDGLVRISIEHVSPDVASQWVAWLIEDLNAVIRLNDISEAERAISYLESQIQETSVAELRNVFFSLIEQQTQTVMLAKVSEEYFLRTIDPPVAPDYKDRPGRTVIVILGGLLGGTLGIAIVLLIAVFRRAT